MTLYAFTVLPAVSLSCLKCLCTCDTFFTIHYMQYLFYLLCPIHVVLQRISYLVFVWAFFYCLCGQFITWHSVPFLFHLLCPLHVLQSLHFSLRLGLIDVILYMWYMYHMTFYAFPVKPPVYLSCRYSSDPLLPLRLSDVILSMSNIYHMILCRLSCLTCSVPFMS